MLEWIDQSSVGASGDPEAKKKVRSQAMRDFRRRQRVEREARRRIGEEQCRSSRDVKSVRHHQSSSFTSQRPAPVLREIERVMTLDEDRSPRFEDEILDVSKDSKDQRTCLRSMTECPSTRLILSGLLPEQSWNSRPTPTLLPKSPSRCSPHTADPLFSPAQREMVLDHCGTYVHWLRPSISPEHARSLAMEAWDASPCPMLFAACSLAAVGHLSGDEMDRQAARFSLYKDRVLREVKERMHHPQASTSCETLAALTFLTSFELSRASLEARTHLRGLQSILELRQKQDGFNKHQPNTMMETLDALQAVMFDTPLILSPPVQEPPVLDVARRLTTLLETEQEEFHRMSERSLSEPLEGFPQLLRCAAESANWNLTNTGSANGLYRRYWNCLEDFRKRYCQDGNGMDEDGRHVSRACYHQVAMMYNLVVNNKPYDHPSNGSHGKGLFVSIRAGKSGAWERLPFLRIWVLLTGLATARDASFKSFFKAHLIQIIHKMGPRRWDQVKELVDMFLQARENLQGRETPCARSGGQLATPDRSEPATPPPPRTASLFDEENIDPFLLYGRNQRSDDEE